MTRIALPRRAALLVATTVAALVVATGCSNDDMGDMSHGGTGNTTGAPPASAAAFNDADVTFAQNMVVHHQQAVEMSTLAASKASDPEVKRLAAQIKAAQEPEIRVLAGWLSAWGRPSAPAGGHGSMSMPGMMSDAEMTQLKAATGTDFDRTFARLMVAHHNGAIQMAREEQAKGANAEAKSLAAAVMRTQEAEVKQLDTIIDRL